MAEILKNDNDTVLEKLILCDNEISLERGSSLEDVVIAKKSLSEIDLCDNPIQSSALPKLVSILVERVNQKVPVNITISYGMSLTKLRADKEISDIRAQLGTQLAEQYRLSALPDKDDTQRLKRYSSTQGNLRCHWKMVVPE
jgi:hypothetical protein